MTNILFWKYSESELLMSYLSSYISLWLGIITAGIFILLLIMILTKTSFFEPKLEQEQNQEMPTEEQEENILKKYKTEELEAEIKRRTVEL